MKNLFHPYLPRFGGSGTSPCPVNTEFFRIRGMLYHKLSPETSHDFWLFFHRFGQVQYWKMLNQVHQVGMIRKRPRYFADFCQFEFRFRVFQTNFYFKVCTDKFQSGTEVTYANDEKLHCHCHRCGLLRISICRRSSPANSCEMKLEEKVMENDMNLNLEEMEDVTGGGMMDLTAKQKEKMRKVIKNAKKDGATLEDFISKYPGDPKKNEYVQFAQLVGISSNKIKDSMPNGRHSLTTQINPRDNLSHRNRCESSKAFDRNI